MTVGKPIKLVDAPARFLGGDLARLVELTGSGAKALEALSDPDPGILVLLRREIIAEGRGGSQAQREEEIYAQVEKMIADFKKLGAEQRIAASGICSATGLRQVIPPELWDGLKYDFVAGAARPPRGSRSGFSYTFIEIQETRSEADADDLLASLVEWLAQRRANAGVEPKKVLAEAAKAEFASAFRVRIFNEAYRQVYGRSRGRPAQLQK